MHKNAQGHVVIGPIGEPGVEAPINSPNPFLVGEPGPEMIIPVRETKGPEILQHLPGGSIVVDQSVIKHIIPMMQRIEALELQNKTLTALVETESERIEQLEAQIAKWLNT